MFDYRLKVFHTVARRLSFTKAADELNVSQPAVTKHIKELENQLHTKLFHRNGTTIQLTGSGERLVKYAEKMRILQRDLEFDLFKMNGQEKGQLKLGASTTIAQYVLPEILAKFHASHPDIRIELMTGNTEKITKLLKNGQIDLGIIEGESRSSLFDYSNFGRDEIVLVAKTTHAQLCKQFGLKDLYKVDFVLREPGSGTQEFIESELKNSGVRLQDISVVMQLDSSESIKNYLLHSDAMAFLSINSVRNELKNNQLTVVEMEGFSLERDFQLITLKGEQAELVQLFKKFALYN